MKKIVPQDAILIPPEAKRVFEGVIFDVYQWQQELYDGTTATFERLKRPDTVLVVGVADDKIVLIDDDQVGRGKVLRLPGGRVEPTDESTLAAAQREIAEETGYEFENWRLVNVVQPENKLEWFAYIYVANKVVGRHQSQNDGGEKITIRLTSFEDTIRYVHENRGLIGKSRELFESVLSVDDLKAMPEFQGKEVDR